MHICLYIYHRSSKGTSLRRCLAGMSLEPCGGPRGREFSYERGTPVQRMRHQTPAPPGGERIYTCVLYMYIYR